MKQPEPCGPAFLTSDERPRVWRYSHAAGPARSRFLLGLRDGPVILGTRCSGCRRVYVPPRLACHHCFEPLQDWIEVSREGTLETYTCTANPLRPDAPPAAYGIIRLDGADTGFVHRLGGAPLDSFRTGIRVQAVFASERSGDIRDIEYFTPAPPAEPTAQERC